MNNVVSLLDLQLAMFPEQDPVSGTLNFALLDSNGKSVIENYERFLPDFGASETWWAFFFVLVGIGILLGLDWYGKNRKK